MATIEDFATANGLVIDTFFFRQKNADGSKKIPDTKLALPYTSADGILAWLTDESVAEDRKTKALTYLADLHNDAVYGETQKQIAPLVKDGTTPTQDHLNLPELDFWTLVFKEKVDRKMFGDELVADAIVDFTEVLTQQFNVSLNGATAAATETFNKKLANYKTNKKVLGLFQTYLANWIDKSAQQDRFIGIASHYAERIETYLSADQESIVGKFE
jgi:hypothetical protein